MKVREVLQRLGDDGWILKKDRAGGSHRQYVHPRKPGKVTVAGKENAEVPPGTLKSIFNQAGWDWRDR